MENPLKKSISIAVAVIMVASSALFTGCGKSSKYSEFKWPDSELASKLPTPKSNVGKINSDSASNFWVDVANTSKDDYSEYVSNCKEKGFTVDYMGSDESYYADNEEGYSLTLMYQKDSVMSVSISEPNKDTEESSKEESSKEEESKSEDNDSDSVSSDFKEAMDSYEEFFDEYVDFMKKYKDSDNSVTMLADYTDFMKKYTETMEKMNDIDEDKLSAADAAYYAEVTARITKKVTEVSGY